MKKTKLWLTGLLAPPLLLTGCSILPSTRKLPIPKTPAVIQTVSPEELVAQMNQRWGEFDNLTATVDIQATLLKPKQGMATDYPSCRGWIVLRKPNSLRVAGQYFGVRVFDMASDGNTFTLLVPPKNKAMKGSSSVTKKSENQFENLRPGFFFDAMVVRGLDTDNFYAQIADVETLEDPSKKHLYTMPEYVLSITRHAAPGSRRDTPVRVVTFHRDDLLPYNQDLYDGQGNLESQVTYSAYQDFSGSKYPTKVTIKRPIEGIQIILNVQKVSKNVKLPENEFQIEIPEGTQIVKLD